MIYKSKRLSPSLKIFPVLIFICSCYGSALSQAKYIDSLKRILLEKSQQDSAYINLLNEIALTYWSISSDSVLSLSTRSLTLAKKISYLKGEAEATKNIGVAYWGKGDYKQALDYYQRAIPMAEKANYLKVLGGCYNNIAIIYVNQGKYLEALQNHSKALSIREKIGDKKSIATSLNNIGVIHEQLGHLTEALDYQLKGLKIRESIQDEFGIAMSYNNIANLYGLQNQFDKSLEYQQNALKIRERIGDLNGLSQSLSNVGDIYFRQGKDSLALIYFLKTLQLQESSLHDEYSIAHLLLGMANIYSRTGFPQKAELNYLKSKTKMQALQDSSGLIGVLIGLADVKLLVKNYNEALALGKQSLSISEKIGQVELIQDSHKLLSLVFERMNNHKQALFHYKQYKIYSDRLVNSETQRKTTQLQDEYDFQKKESQLREAQQLREVEFEKTSNRQRLIIVVVIFGLVSVSIIAVLIVISRKRLRMAFNKLELANKLIHQQNEQLSSMNATKEQLLSIVSHDARAPLNSLQAMLQLFSQNALSYEEAKKLFGTLSGQIAQVTNFMETLLQWVKNQFGQYKPEIVNVEITSLIKQVVQLLSPIASGKGIEIRFDETVSAINLQADQEMVRTILRNLISNAIKFSHKNGMVKVDMVRFDQFVKVNITDQGVGISKDNIDKLLGNTPLTTKGTNAEVGTGIGIQLCKRLVELNHGQFGIESLAEQGSSFWFSLPASA